MTAYYNEWDPFAADWLENLILVGAIAPGIVDRRSIEDVTPGDLSGFTQCHFFAGIGVWSYALRQAGWSDDRPIWTASCPCQPFSSAGKGNGFDDERHLWPALYWLYRTCGPDVMVGEQVSSKDGLAWLDLVQSDVENTGAAFGALDLCAAGVGAPHIRQRSYWLADAVPAGRSERRTIAGDGQIARGGIFDRLADSNGQLRDGRGDARSGRRTELAVRRELIGLDDDDDARPQRHPRHDSGSSRQWEGEARPVTASGISGGLGDPASCGPEFRSRKFGVSPEQTDGQSISERRPSGHNSRPGPVNGFWRSADWLFCRDGKWRPVEPSYVKMVDGPAGNMGHCGNEDSDETKGPQVNVTKMSILPDCVDPKEMVDGSFGGFDGFQQTDILRPVVHGGGLRRDDKNKEPEEQPSTIGQTAADELRDMPTTGASGSPPGRKSDEQRRKQFAEFVCLLPSSIARAKANRDGFSETYLCTLLETILSAGPLSHPSFPIEKAWQSLSEETQDQIRLDFDDTRLTLIRPFPLASGELNRVGRLRGYGNAIVSQVAQNFIESVMDYLDD